jgi:hypothetical protein
MQCTCDSITMLWPRSSSKPIQRHKTLLCTSPLQPVTSVPQISSHAHSTHTHMAAPSRLIQSISRGDMQGGPHAIWSLKSISDVMG